ncbi:MAG TPA: hypothetical protein VJN18_27265 [Polyangiaceae bacterium]|nr:hypothetical protein [Polyangiaceae bacterium]
MKSLVALLFVLAACSSGDDAGEPEPTPPSPYEWQCLDTTSARGPFCDCQRGEHAFVSELRSCPEAPCCYTGTFDDGTDECICHSQEFQDADGQTCEETVVHAGRAAGSAFMQVLSCPP